MARLSCWSGVFTLLSAYVRVGLHRICRKVVEPRYRELEAKNPDAGGPTAKNRPGSRGAGQEQNGRGT